MRADMIVGPEAILTGSLLGSFGVVNADAYPLSMRLELDCSVS
jgi:hypothetical protein